MKDEQLVCKDFPVVYLGTVPGLDSSISAENSTRSQALLSFHAPPGSHCGHIAYAYFYNDLKTEIRENNGTAVCAPVITMAYTKVIIIELLFVRLWKHDPLMIEDLDI